MVDKPNIRIALVFNSKFAYEKFGQELFSFLSKNKGKEIEVLYGFCDQSGYFEEFPGHFKVANFCYFLPKVVKVCRSFDVIIHNNRNASIFFRIVKIFSFFFGVRFKSIYIARGLYFHDGNSILTRRFLQFLEIVFGFSDDKILSQSYEDYCFLAVWPSLRSKLTWIGNGVRDEFFELNKKRVRKDGTPLIIGYVGRITPGKGIERLLALAASLPLDGSILFRIVGGPRTQSDIRFFETLKVPSNVEVTGLVDDVSEFICDVDIGLHLSDREGVPRSVCEMLAAGIFVICSDVRGCRELIIPWVNGVLVSNDEELMLALNRCVVTDVRSLSNSVTSEFQSSYSLASYLARIESGLEGL